MANYIKRFQNNGNYYYFGDAPTHASGVTLNKSSLTFTEAGQTEQLVATVTPSDAVEKSVTWTSSDTTVAKVYQDGTVECVNPGDCTITCTVNDGGYTATCGVSNKKKIDFLLIGGGGAGATGNGSGGGAGGFIECCNYSITEGEYNIKIGLGGTTRTTYCQGMPGGFSSFNGIIAYGGGGGGRCSSTANCSNGASGGGGYMYPSTSSIGGLAIYNNCGFGIQGNNGGGGCKWGNGYSGGGGGGAGAVGTNGGTYCGGVGGAGKASSMSGTSIIYSAGGGGGGSNTICSCGGGCGGSGVGGNGITGYSNPTITNASTYGSGGGGTYSAEGCGCQGVFILRYLTSCGYDITGGTCYTCGDYTIHCFTSDGTLCVN